MFNKRVFAVLKRELRERVLTKSFIISTLALPLLMGALFGFQFLMMSIEGDAGTKITIVTEIDQISDVLKEKFSKMEWVKNGDYSIEYDRIKKNQFEKYLEEKKDDILKGKITGVLYIPQNALKNKNIQFYSKNTKNLTVQGKISHVLNEVLIDFYFKDKNISSEDIMFARTRVGFNSFKVSKDKDVKKDGGGNLALSYVFSFLLYISLLMMGGWVMNSVIEEKTNRVSEVVLSSVNAKELMVGKIFGNSLTGLLQMAVWLSPILIVVWFKLPVLPVGLNISISLIQVSYFLINFFIGLLTFVGLYASVGAIFSTPQEAQSGVAPLMMLIIIPFFIAISIIKSPTNILAAVSSMLPFASIMVMPARAAVIDVPIWQFIVSFIVSIGTILALFPIAGKIYRIGILSTGKKPTLKELIKWIKLKS